MTHNFKIGQTVIINTANPSVDVYFGKVKGLRVEIKEFGDNPIHGETAIVKGYSEKHKGMLTQVIDVAALSPLAVEPTAPMTKAVLKLLEAKGSLTALEAGGVLKCRMLPYQINRLRNLGWSIQTELKNDPIDGQRYARYHLLDSSAA